MHLLTLAAAVMRAVAATSYHYSNDTIDDSWEAEREFHLLTLLLLSHDIVEEGRQRDHEGPEPWPC